MTFKRMIIAGALALPFLAASPAFAQDEAKTDAYIGANIGYHNLGDNPIGANDGAIYGVYAGVDIPAGESLIFGVEGNFNLGSNAIDSEYGVAAKIGVRAGDKGQLFVRGGYQEVNVDLAKISGGLVTGGIDDTEGDYLVGVGGQYKLSDNMSFRVVLDTIAFDSTRITGGLSVHF
ncbi:MAG: outer membrane beta-barrel protein [Blastomonas sp.]